jgi:AcrR family transcriptional regulator
MFAEHGFAGTSLTNISQVCGISEGLILHHFQSKKTFITRYWKAG